MSNPSGTRMPAAAVSVGPQGAVSATSMSKEHQLRSYQQRLREAVKATLENFNEIVKLSRLSGDDAPDGAAMRLNSAEQDMFEMSVRAGNICRAAEALLKLIADLKLFVILNDLPSPTGADDKIPSLQRVQAAESRKEVQRLLADARDKLARDLHDLEEGYYLASSIGATSSESVDVESLLRRHDRPQ